MKTYCVACWGWITWSRLADRWYHLYTSETKCRWLGTTATRSEWLPMVDFIDDDLKLVRP